MTTLHYDTAAGSQSIGHYVDRLDSRARARMDSLTARMDVLDRAIAGATMYLRATAWKGGSYMRSRAERKLEQDQARLAMLEVEAEDIYYTYYR